MKKGVQKIYFEVASTYDLINHIMTFGLDFFWRKKAVRWTSLSKGAYCLDVCSGTGDMAKFLSRNRDRNVRIVAIDFNPDMIALAKKKVRSESVSFCLGDAMNLPFRNNAFDLITIGFATRNINSNRERLVTHFREFHRLLKPGGVFINLETSQPSNLFLRRLFHAYAKHIVQPLGSLLSRSRSGYRYLLHTLTRFYDLKTLSDILINSGFSRVEGKRLFLGIAAIHRAMK